MAIDGSVDLGFPTLSADGLTGFIGTGSVDLGFPTLSGDLPTGFIGIGSVTFMPFSLSGDGLDGLLDPDELQLVLELLTVDGACVGGIDLTGASILPLLSVSGSIEPALPLPELTLDGTGYAGEVATGDIGFERLTLAGGIDAGVVLPEWTLAATGDASARIDGLLELPLLEADGALDTALPLPQLELAATALAGTVATASVALPALSLAAFTYAINDLELPQLTLAATGLVGSAAAGALAWPAWQVDGQQIHDTTSTGSVTFNLLAVGGLAHGVTLIAGAVTLAKVQVAALGVAGNVATAVLTVPLLTLDAAGWPQFIGHAMIDLPALLVAASGHGPAVAPSTTIAVNTQLAAVSLYDALAANSFARFAGVTLAATATGIVAMLGDDDLGEPIAASVVSGVSDYGIDQLKRIVAGYVGYRAGGLLDLTLITDEHLEYVYRLSPRLGADTLHTARVKFGRGVDGRYWQWKFANVGGANFTLDALALDILPLSRR